MIEVLHGDCREVLKTLAPDSIEACFTDPPYEISFMSKKWDSTGVAFQSETWAEVYRVLKPGAYLMAFGGSRTYHRMVCAIEDAGFIIHPFFAWIFGSGFPKATNLSKQLDKAAGAEREIVRTVTKLDAGFHRVSGDGKDQFEFYKTHEINVTAPATPEAQQWDGWFYGLQSLKPSMEPICLAQKPAIREGMVANVLTHGTGAINIDACRVTAQGRPLRERDHQYRPENFDLPSGSRAIGETDQGRWPANVLHDGSEEVEAAFAAFGEKKAGVAVKRNMDTTKRTESGWAQSIGNEDIGFGDSGSASRFFYCAKASKADRAGSKHPTVKPIDLVRYFLKLITPPNGTVLDPFAGTGTTGEAAMLEGFSSVMIEQDLGSVEDIRHRIRRWSGQDAPLFAAD